MPFTAADTDAGLRPVIEEFLYDEADLLDAWRLLDWLELFTPDGTYVVPAPDLPDGDPRRDLVLVSDDGFLLGQRVASLLKRTAHAEFPHSRTRRLIANVRAAERADGRLSVRANFAVYRMRRDRTDCYVGRYLHVLAGRDDLRFVERRAVLDHDTLRAQGKLSIIL